MPDVPTAKGRADQILAIASVSRWSAWLASHHGSSRGVLLRIAKTSHAPKGSITYTEAVDAALAWGWIDSQKHALDAQAWLQRFTPRKASSPWSKINRAKAAALIAAGKMEPPGLAAVERAQRNGLWERAYDGARTADVPADLAAALAGNVAARAFFETLDATNRYAILYRVQTAKKQETRADRIARFTAMCARHETLYPQRGMTTAARPAGTPKQALRTKRKAVARS